MDPKLEFDKHPVSCQRCNQKVIPRGNKCPNCGLSIKTHSIWDIVFVIVIVILFALMIISDFR
jgi:hypothetical protein